MTTMENNTCLPHISVPEVATLNKYAADLQPDEKNGCDFDNDNLYALINNTRDLMWSVDRDYRLITSNNAFDEIIRAMTGKEICKGDDVLAEGFSVEQKSRYMRFYDRALSGESFSVNEYTDTPVEFWSQLSFYPIRKGESIVGTACYSHNITEQRKAENSLREAHDRLLFHVENTMMGFIELDSDLRVITWSKRAEEIFGWTVAEAKAMQKQILRMVHEDDLGEVSKISKKLLAGELGKYTMLFRGYTKDGRVIWCKWFNSVLKDKNGKVNTIMSQVLDITDKKVADERIIHTSRLYAFISQINQAVVKLNDETTLFREACRIAVGVGKFEAAWISMVDRQGKRISIAEQYGLNPEDIDKLTNTEYEEHGIVGKVMLSGGYRISNCIESEDLPAAWKSFARDRGWRSCMALPIKKSGDIVAIFYLMSRETYFFDQEEVALLEEATGDISFALETFEKEAQRKRAERKLLHSERRLKQAQSIAHLGNWELNLETGMGLWSEETCRIYGLSAVDKMQTYDSWLSFIHPDDRAYVLSVAEEANRTQSGYDFHHRIVRKDDSIRHIFSQAEYEFDSQGQATGLYGVSHDVTEAKLAEEVIARSKENLRLIVDLIPHSIFAKNIDGKFLFANKSFAALYGRSPEDLIDKTIVETIPVKSESEYFIEQDREVIRSGQSIIIPEHTLTDHNGNLLSFHSIKVPYSVAGTNEKAVLGIKMDITEQKKADEERTKMMEEIVQRVKDLEQFSYIVSHNLRAPVANISGLTEILKITGLNEDEKNKFLAELDGSVTKLDNVIKDLNVILQTTRKDNMQKETLRFSAVLDTIESSFEKQLLENDVHIKRDFSAINEMLTVKTFIHSIFVNLISNAIKYKQPGIPGLLEISSDKVDGKVVLLFKDNGMGIDLSKRSGQVFGLYKRFHTQIEGKGMGLFMVKTQVESLGGKIAIASEVNKGTEFRIEFETTN